MADPVNVDLTAHPGVLGLRAPGVLVDPVPEASGRWQPTRAGAVNSWLWTDEQFLFRNGWLALVGRNGSGKSLTAAMLFPTLIDGDVSQKALSVAGHAIGTLGDRHTNRKPGIPKTGLWWQEYGCADSGGSGEREAGWLTTGLWLRNQSGSKTTDRAWFLVQARIGDGLTVERDRVPVDIEDLARQLAALGGQLFASSDQLTRIASRHITVLGETAYPEAVRAALYRPLDLDQLGALTNVLRALRGVRVNDKIPPDHMQATLTSALPVLDGERMRSLARALTETEQMQRRLEHARQQKEALSDIAGDYRRYAGAVAAAAAAQMLHDYDDYQRRAREQEQLFTKRSRQEGIRDLAGEAAERLGQQLTELTDTIDVLQERVRGHKGAALEQLNAHANQLEATAEEATADANRAKATAVKTRQDSDAQGEKAAAAAISVQEVFSRIRSDAAELDASAYCQKMAEASAHLADTVPDEAEVGFEEQASEALAPVRAWMTSRGHTLNAVGEALAALEAVKRGRDEAGNRSALQQAAADEATLNAEEAAESAALTDATARDRLMAVAAALRRLPRLPESLLLADPLDPDAIKGWAERALQEVLTALDVPGAESHATTAGELARQASTSAETARRDATDAVAHAAAAASALASLTGTLPGSHRPIDELSTAVGEIPQAAEVKSDASNGDLNANGHRITTAERESRTYLGERRRMLQKASDLLSDFRHAQSQADLDEHAAVAAEGGALDARQTADEAAAAAAASTVAWINDTLAWFRELRVLDVTALTLPGPEDPGTADPSALLHDVAMAHRKAEAALNSARAKADTEAGLLSPRLNSLAAEIAATERGTPPPGAPSWRPDRSKVLGAPLWALVDFAPGIQGEQAARLEGALLAAGILDAWVSPNGELRSGDIQLSPGRPLHGLTLADLLVPEDDATVPAEYIRSLLASIRVSDCETDDDASVVFNVAGVIRSGLIQAASPANWSPRYIGPSARERARQQRLSELRSEHAVLDAAFTEAAERIRGAERDISCAAAEAAGVPDASTMIRQRSVATELGAEAERKAVTAAIARTLADASLGRARNAWTSAAQACSYVDVPVDPEVVAAAISLCGDLPDLVAQAAAWGRTALAALSTANVSAARAAVLADRHADAETALRQVRLAAEESQAERDQFPSLDASRQARRRAIDAERSAQTAAENAAAADAELKRQEHAVKKALADLDRAARTSDGRMVPTDPAVVTAHRQRLAELADTVSDWSRAAGRAHLLAVRAAAQHRVADEAEGEAGHARARATKLHNGARTARHRYNEELRQHGRDYQDLLVELQNRRAEQEGLKTNLKAEEDKGHDAEKELAAIAASLDSLEERRQAASSNCTRSLSRMQLIFDHGLIHDVVGAQALTRPTSPNEAAPTARQLLEGRSLQHNDLVGSADVSARQALNRLDTRIRSVRDRMLRLGRQIHLEDVAETGWRRVAVSEQGQERADAPISAITTTKSLREALEALRISIEKLESDFNEKVRTEVKGTLLSDLRKQINVRIELASQIVDDITETLKKVRTGVARVGVKLAWRPKDNPLAVQAISLIRDPRFEGELDDMYNFFIKQLVAERDENMPWPDRVRQVFDYRNWYEWEIQLTHADFAEPGAAESFRKVTPRNNPLETLSTGEKRLAVMLPLLAAARAFYSVKGYHGPRTIFLDELNAAFDPQNLRMMLALLREWDFDLIATLPTMDPLLVSEAGSVAIHRIGKQREEFRYAIPCIWDGNGQPITVQIAVGNMTTRRRHSAKSANAVPDPEEALFDMPSGAA